jgi:bleomycin hydrolase
MQDIPVAWASDVSDKGFNFKQGVALVPDMDEKKASALDWERAFSSPGKMKTISQELRQTDFDNYATTDDHGMHLTGIAHDQNGNKYYIVKNSWGVNNPYSGYIYVSEAYVRLRTTVIFLNKNAISETLRKKLGII